MIGEKTFYLQAYGRENRFHGQICSSDLFIDWRFFFNFIHFECVYFVFDFLFNRNAKHFFVKHFFFFLFKCGYKIAQNGSKKASAQWKLLKNLLIDEEWRETTNESLSRIVNYRNRSLGILTLSCIIHSICSLFISRAFTNCG